MMEKILGEIGLKRLISRTKTAIKSAQTEADEALSIGTVAHSIASSAQSQVNTLNGTVTKIQGDVSSAQSGIGALNSLVADTQDRVTVLEGRHEMDEIHVNTSQFDEKTMSAVFTITYGSLLNPDDFEVRSIKADLDSVTISEVTNTSFKVVITDLTQFTITAVIAKKDKELTTKEYVQAVDPSYIPRQLCFTSQENGSTIKLVQNGATSSYDLEVSTDGLNWHKYYLTTIITLNAGEKSYWRGNNTSMGVTTMQYKHFVMTGKIAASGNTNSILNASKFDSVALNKYAFYSLFENCNSLLTPPELPAVSIAEYCYYLMFSGCTSLTTAPELPATTLVQYCYSNMFFGCTSLVNPPELPALTLTSGCYYAMFSGCTALVNTPNLVATTLSGDCYHQMFYGCTSLVSTSEIPATTLKDFCCFEMFYGCSKLTKVPSILPATTLAYSCYGNMFSRCSSLTTAPELPATTLAGNCYNGMFNGCTLLTTAPVLPATTLISNCYNYLFQDCANLKYIKAMFTTAPETSYTSNWVSGVATSGTFVKNAEATWETESYRGVSGIPTGWTVETATE